MEKSALPTLPDGEVWCEGFGDSNSGGVITCNICHFCGSEDDPPEWAEGDPLEYGSQWPWDYQHGYCHPQTTFIIGRWPMTWKEFKTEVERQGVKDEDQLSYIDWSLYNSVDVTRDEMGAVEIADV